MLKSLLLILLSAITFNAFAQVDDSLFVFPKDNSWLIKYHEYNSESVFALSRRFHVPPAILAGVNGVSYQSALSANSNVNIPTGAYNLQKAKPINPDEARPLYYRATGDDNLYKLSRYSGVSQRTLQDWNSLVDTRIEGGQVLFVGWVMYDATNTNAEGNASNARKELSMGYGAAPADPHPMPQAKAGKITTIVKPLDTVKRVDTPAIERLFLKQTNNEETVVDAKGPAVFFDMKSVTSKNAFYAFYNDAPRGTVIKVHDPSTGVVIYVKVMGPLPATKQYVGATIGISGNAKAAFNVNRDKLWIELRHAK